jgi:hypothetical protein
LLDDHENTTAAIAIGPVRAAVVAGAGRGLVASRDVRAGELLLACPPLALLRSPDRSRPHPADLVDVVLDACWEAAAAAENGDDDDDDGAEKLAPLAWLLALHAPDESEDGKEQQQFDTPILPLFEPETTTAQLSLSLPPLALAAARSALEEWRRNAKPNKPPHALAPPWLQRRAARVVKANAVGEAHGDLAAALLAFSEREGCGGNDDEEGRALAASNTTQGHVCLFPHFSLLNHDCSPNAVHLTLQSGALVVVRAVRPINAGQPLSISYLGRPQLRPLGERRMALQEGYGFKCACARCEREEQALAEAGWGELAAAAAAGQNGGKKKTTTTTSATTTAAREAAAEAAAAAETLAVRAEGEWAPDARWAARAVGLLGAAAAGGSEDGGDDDDEEKEEPASAKERAARRQRALRTASRVARVAGGASRALLETAALAARGGLGRGNNPLALRHELAASAYAALEAAADAETVLAAEAERKWRKRVVMAARGKRLRNTEAATAIDVSSARSAAGAASARAAALALCASALEGVSAGSDLHCAVTAQRCAALEVWREAAEWGAERVEAEGDDEALSPPSPPPAPLVDAARAARHRAHIARYGDDVPQERVDLLMKGSLEMYA